MSENYKKLTRTLRQLFEMDKADLDFGIYLIMNQKRDEINSFLENDLLPQVKEAFAGLEQGDKAGMQKELEAAIEQAKSFGAPDPENAPPVLEIKEKMASSVDITAMEQEVYSHLHTFFSRYYDKGDFISLRRYKNDTYAIPYEGEEVKLHWANADQYYIKSSEHLRDYAFIVKGDDDKSIRIKLLEADTEKDNTKSQNGERRFVLDADNPLTVVGDELRIHFNYIPKPKSTKQETLNKKTVEVIFGQEGFDEWLAALQQKAPTEKNPDRTLLEKHLNDYTARNTFDYFIHKDLGRFLRRELDFYVKNEVLHLDDIDSGAVVATEQLLRKIKAIRSIAHKIIIFLAQLEDFQKKLWLKKKFVVETNYCVTIDRVPKELYEDIVACDEQWQEWATFGLVDNKVQKIKERKFILTKQPFLVVDTRFYNVLFKDRLASFYEELDEQCNGLLIHSDNFHALNLLQDRYREKVKCIYIDPPFNTGGDDFLYKDKFQESSWLSLLVDRIQLSTTLLMEGGTFSASIDLKELDKMIFLLDSRFGQENRKSNVTIKRGSLTGAKVINPGPINISENVLFYSYGRKKWQPERAYRTKKYDSRYGTIILNPDDHYSEWIFSSVLQEFANTLSMKKSKLRKLLADNYDSKLFEFVINNRNSIIQLAGLDEKSISKEAVQLKLESKKQPDKIFHLSRTGANDYFIKNGSVILFYKDRFKKIGEELLPGEPISDIWDDVLPNDIHNEGGVELRKGKKPEKLLHRVFESSTKKEEWILDFFAGTATAAAVAIKSHRKWINIDCGQYFNTKALQRVKNTLYGEQSGISKTTKWQGGGFFKYLTLESYEDTLNNLVVKKPSPKQQSLLDVNPELKEDYILSYFLDVETKDSSSLLNLDQFADPFNYQLNIATGSVGATKPTTVDLVETFNYLLGLTVKQIDTIRGFKVVVGHNPQEESVLVVWRVLADKDNAALEEFMDKSSYHPRDTEFDHIYVNGDHTMEDPHSKVKMTEIEFKRLMFDVQDV